MVSSVKAAAAFLIDGDPVAGKQALQFLIDQGEAAQEQVLEHCLPRLRAKTQAQRRFRRYAAARGAGLYTPLSLLIEDAEKEDHLHGVAIAATALPPSEWFKGKVYTQIMTAFDSSGIGRSVISTKGGYYRQLFHVWAAAGGDGASLWHLVKKDSYNWEKLAEGAFDAACLYAARTGRDGLWAVAQLLTHRWSRRDFADLETIPPEEGWGARDGALTLSHCWSTVHSTFCRWRSPAAADAILAEWSTHAHPRVRQFGAMILSTLGIKRTAGAIERWYNRESDPGVRDALLDALDGCGAADGADALLRLGMQRSRAFARCGYRATDKSRAIAALMEWIKENPAQCDEALLALGRLGISHPLATEHLGNHDGYTRAMAALSLAYAGDKKGIAMLAQLQADAAQCLESILLSAAMVIGGVAGGKEALRQALIQNDSSSPALAGATSLLSLWTTVKEAIVDAVQRWPELEDAWWEELQPFDTPAISRPVTPLPETNPEVPPPGAPSKAEPPAPDKKPDGDGDAQEPVDLIEKYKKRLLSHKLIALAVVVFLLAVALAEAWNTLREAAGSFRSTPAQATPKAAETKP